MFWSYWWVVKVSNLSRPVGRLVYGQVQSPMLLTNPLMESPAGTRVDSNLVGEGGLEPPVA